MNAVVQPQSQPRTVAVVGATGAVGIEIIKCLEDRSFPTRSLRLFASPRSAGRTLPFRNQQVTIEALTPECFKGVDVALFSAGSGISKEFAPHAVAAGAVVVDNSSAFRMDKDIPLVVPEINPGTLAAHRGIIANPNCVAIIATVPLWRNLWDHGAGVFTWPFRRPHGARLRTPLIALASVTNLPLADLSAMTGRQLPFFAVLGLLVRLLLGT